MAHATTHLTDAPLWQPTDEAAAATQMAAFFRAVSTDGSLLAGASIGAVADQSVIPDPGALYSHWHAWSVREPAAFWAAVWRFTGVIGGGWDHVLVGGHRMEPPDPILGPRWFVGARLNFAENLLRRRDDEPAIIARDETGRRRALTFAELADEVRRAAGAFRAMGVKPGDRVAGFLPNIPEAVIAALGAASIGAVWSSCSPDFGARGVLDRFGQIAPKVLIVADGYHYVGKRIDCLGRTREIVAALPTLERVVIVPFAGEETGQESGLTSTDVSFDASSNPPSLAAGVVDSVPRAQSWDDFLATGADAPERFTRLPFDHPLYIMYSSGTTGLPKCMVHGAGGTLLQHLKEHRLHTDLRAGERLFYFTTCGWMMWNWLLSALASETTIVLYDGAPMPQSNPAALWDLAAEERVTVFGASAKFLAMSQKSGLAPARSHDLRALRAILSTGSPLAEHSYEYVYRDVRPDVHLASISGGTDIISCFALGNPMLPVYRGELQCRGLGMAVEIRDEDGALVRDGVAGELVCTRPFPSMPIAFWDDDADKSKYRAAYFEHFYGLWRHGDWAELTSHDGLIIHGRSDATLNPGGVRIGTAEIYRQVEQLREVMESVVVGQDIGEGADKDVRIVLFVRLREGVELDDALRERIKRVIRTETSPHHVPKVIEAVDDIPRTISGKISEIAVRNVIHGRAVKNTDALANPQALELYKRFAKSE